MVGEWPLVPLGEISDLFDGPHQTAPLTDDGPVVYLNVGDIRGGRIELRNSGRVTEETAASWSRRVVPEAGDVVFGYEATLGQAALLSSAYRWCLGRRVGLLRPRQERVDPRFLTYSWYSPRFQETLRSNRVGGTTIESIRLTDLPSWDIALPPLSGAARHRPHPRHPRRQDRVEPADERDRRAGPGGPRCRSRCRRGGPVAEHRPWRPSR